MDQFVAEWNTWRDSRNSALARPFGWLSVAGLYWLDEATTWPGAPGDFTVEDGWVRVVLKPGTTAGPAAETFDLLRGEKETETTAAAPAPPRPQVQVEENGFSAKLPPEGSLDWFTVGHVLYELIERGGRTAIRIRDSKSPLLNKFIEVPVFDHDRSFVFLGKFTPYDPPQKRMIGTAQSDVQLQTEVVGTVSFESESGEVRLEATGSPTTGLHLTFHDPTNGRSTSMWRMVDLGIPGADGSVIVDFNRAVNYPCAFTAFATCPAPVEGNVVPFPVTAGEQRPPFYLSENGVNTPFLLYTFWDEGRPDPTPDWYADFGLDATVLDPVEDTDPSLVGYDGLALSGKDLSPLGRRARSRLIKVSAEALTSRIPVVGVGAYSEFVITAQREVRELLGYQDGVEPVHETSPGRLLVVMSSELKPAEAGFRVLRTDKSGLSYIELPQGLPLDSEFADSEAFEDAMESGAEVSSWQEFAYRLATLVSGHR
ncbi:DUF1684 domain-containing protein [Brevibacterium sp.]|uniref:DUF1684 domain-containing protein n=1 Tax=Brevibacterium sp. TaxID=1701 RepID=UPI002811F384|nr:DUF1684 domain-containing protein [Brevibacterium sp.]